MREKLRVPSQAVVQFLKTMNVQGPLYNSH